MKLKIGILTGGGGGGPNSDEVTGTVVSMYIRYICMYVQYLWEGGPGAERWRREEG